MWLSAGCRLARAAPDGNAVPCKIVDEQSGRPATARLRLMDARGNDIVPVGHPTELAPDAQQGDVRFQSKRFAYVDGKGLRRDFIGQVNGRQMQGSFHDEKGQEGRWTAAKK